MELKKFLINFFIYKYKFDSFLTMSQFGYKFKGKYFILGAIGVLGLIFTTGIIQIIFGIYTLGCVIGAIKGDG